MLEKLAKQTAVYGISTIAVRFLSYLLTPVFTRVFEPEAYGIVTDVYALIPFALVVLTMGLESAYFRFAAKADAAAAAAGGTACAVPFSLQKNIQILQNPLQFAGRFDIIRTMVGESGDFSHQSA